MDDVLRVALDRQSELRAEIAEIDEFIRMAESLLRNARQAPATPETRSEISPEARSEIRAETKPEIGSERPQQVEIPDAAAGKASQSTVEPAEQRPSERRFPWSNPQPQARSTDADEPAGPVRRNLMRREAS